MTQQSFNLVFFYDNFILGICGIQYNLNLKKFFSFNNWNHIVKLSFTCCFWTSDEWRVLIQHAGNFENLKKLDLCKF